MTAVPIRKSAIGKDGGNGYGSTHLTLMGHLIVLAIVEYQYDDITQL